MGLLTFGRVNKKLAGFPLKKKGANNVLRTFDHIVQKARFAMAIGHCYKQLRSVGHCKKPAGPGQNPGGGPRAKPLQDLQFRAVNGTRIRHKIHFRAQFFLLTKSHK